MIWAEPPEDRPYSHPDYDPFWAAAQDLDMKLALHSLTSRRKNFNTDTVDVLYRSVILYQEVSRTMSDLILHGVLERFPRLRFVSAENEVGWLPFHLWRMDQLYEKLHTMANVKLAMRPSDYFRRQFFATFIEDPLSRPPCRTWARATSCGPAISRIWPRPGPTRRSSSPRTSRTSGMRTAATSSTTPRPCCTTSPDAVAPPPRKEDPAMTGPSGPEVRQQIGHPVIDGDGHLTELTPAAYPFLREQLTGAQFDRFLREGTPTGRGLAYRSAEEQRRTQAPQSAWWGGPTSDARDKATAMLPALLHERLPEIGIDYGVFYTSSAMGFLAVEDDELRRGLAPGGTPSSPSSAARSPTG